MAVNLNSIGSWSFLTLAPRPSGPTQRVSVEERPGVDGQWFSLNGKSGETVAFNTLYDCATRAAAEVLAHAYETAPGLDALNLMVGGVDRTTVYGEKIKIIAVQVEIEDVIVGVGGFNPPSRAIVSAQWQGVVVKTSYA